MNHYNAENSSDSDWDDRGPLVWGEREWQRYLKHVDTDVARFITLYQKLKYRPDHMDEVARLMGWARREGGFTDTFSDTETPYFDTENLFQEEEEDELVEVYTIHKHPLYVISRGLSVYLTKYWELLMERDQDRVARELSWDFVVNLNDAERNAILAVYALDLGDASLPICMLKRALRSLNATLACLQKIPEGLTEKQQNLFTFFVKDASMVLFDMRELWLHVMQYCREENSRRS
tara:strand:+ start:4795 stop:5499 length:705 start_codon:yes stop_codon:yes gene_type:complete